VRRGAGAERTDEFHEAEPAAARSAAGSDCFRQQQRPGAGREQRVDALEALFGRGGQKSEVADSGKSPRKTSASETIAVGPDG
jgi:hypothetical protein